MAKFGKEKLVDSQRGFIIWAVDYQANSAGIRCLYILCDKLRSLGCEAFITFSNIPAPDLNCSLISVHTATDLVRFQNFIVIYPESVPGNPLNAEVVVRWVLAKPGNLGGIAEYTEQELIFVYSDHYAANLRGPVAGKIYVPTIDQNIFYNDARPDEQRSLTCFYEGKSIYQAGYFDKKSAKEITRSLPAKASLGELFRNSKILYCFDNSTILVYEAAMCGCVAVIIPDGTFPNSDTLKSEELGLAGVAYGVDDLDRARKTMRELPEIYQGTKARFHAQVSQMVAISRAYVPKSISCPHCQHKLEELRPLRRLAADFMGSDGLKLLKFLFRTAVFQTLRRFKTYLLLKLNRSAHANVST